MAAIPLLCDASTNISQYNKTSNPSSIAVTLFPLPTVAKFTDDWEPYTRVIPFGDGYSEREPEGSRPRETWDIEIFYATSAADAVLQAFLDEHGQHKPFEWQSPRSDTPNTYVIKGRVSGTTRRGGAEGFFYSRRCKFERVYGTALVSVSAVSTAANEGVSFTVNFTRDRDTDQLLKVLFSVGGSAEYGVDYTVNGSDSYTSSSGSAILMPGNAATSITIATIDDTTYEANETIILSLMESPDYIASASPLILTISNDDSAATWVPSNISTSVWLTGDDATTVSALDKTITSIVNRQNYYAGGNPVGLGSALFYPPTKENITAIGHNAFGSVATNFNYCLSVVGSPCRWIALVYINVNTSLNTFLFGRSNSYPWHTDNGISMLHPSLSSASIRSGVVYRNGDTNTILAGDITRPSAWTIDVWQFANDNAAIFDFMFRDRSINDGRSWNGWVAEILVGTDVLDTTNRQKIEGYLAHKYSLVGLLPTGHPYKSTPPPPVD